MSKTEVEPIGTCYEDAWRFIIKEKEGELVHGTAISLGRRLGHAWVKLPTGYIWEPYSGEYLTKERFQELVDPIEEYRYTPEQSAIMAARVGKHGPWTKEEREQFLKGGNPMSKPEAERKSFHETIFGKGSIPPLERLRRGQTLNNLIPMSPEEGPPLPRVFAIHWPWKK